MKKEFILVLLSVFIICSFTSAEMIINQQPNKIYNIGDSMTLPVTIKTVTGVSATFTMDLLCGSKQINFYKNGVKLLAGEEKVMDSSLVLTKEILGEYVGTCKIKAILLNEYILTSEFKVSNVLTLQPNVEQKEFEPGQNILIFGNVIKENGQDANGFIDLEIVIGNGSSNIIQKGTINNGMYSMNITLPQNMKAGNYLVKLNAYEVDSASLKTNKGFVNYNIAIKQIPTSLELTFKDNEVKPGTSVEVKAILHDQTGEKIESTAIITIKRGTTEIVEGGGPSETKTGEYMELPIAYNEPPSNWTVFAMSNQLTAESHFVVIENKEIKAEMMNETLVVTNIGNIPYNGTIIIKIGNSSEERNLSLAIDEKKEYKLGAEYEGEYEIEVIDDVGESKLKENALLPRTRTSSISGYAINDGSQTRIGEFFAKPLFWVFIVLVLLCVAFIFLRKMRRKNFNGGGIFKKKVNKHPKVNVAWENRAMPLSKNSKLETKNKASFSSSIKGNKQDVSIVNVMTKNLAEVQANKGNAEEPLQKIINIAENKKAFVYENQNNLFFIITPSKTRTFKNESIALEIAQDAKEILSSYNRIAKHKLDFGISIEYGSIVEKTEQGAMEFMSLGNLMGNSKKMASASQGEILLGESIRNKLTNVRTEKQENSRGVICYKIRDIKYHDEEHSRFIKSFLKKNEGDFRKADTNQTANPNTNKSNTNNSSATSTDPKSLIKGFY